MAEEDLEDFMELSHNSRKVAQNEIIKHLKDDMKTLQDMQKQFQEYARDITQVAVNDMNKAKEVQTEANPAENNTGHRDKIRESLISLIREEEQVQSQLEAMESCLNTIKHADLSENLPNATELLKIEIEKRSKTVSEQDLMKSRLYERWQQKFGQVQEDEDGIMMDPTDVQQSKCPVLGAKLTLDSKPLKNTNCNHIYSTTGIFGLLNQSNSNTIRCPVAGCNKMVSRSSLERDEDFEYELKLLLKSQSN
mmetsp:Transcript_12448/g.15443  ORF Transcript_12448/g.15443 Transcript_12448/m.15443 type:complete len:251 (-) Transcript_12448:629-1381(-)